MGIGDPAGSGCLDSVEGRDIGLDVKDWGPFKEVNAPDNKNAVLHFVQPDIRDPDRVGTVEVPGSKDPVVGLAVQERLFCKSPPLCLVEMGEDDKVREALNVPEPFLVFREDLDSPLT